MILCDDEYKNKFRFYDTEAACISLKRLPYLYGYSVSKVCKALRKYFEVLT